MPIDIMNMVEPGEHFRPATPTLRQRIFVGGEFIDSTEAIIAATDTPRHGLTVREDVVMKGNEPYLWREHYTSLVAKVRKAGWDPLSVDSSDSLKKKIQLLTHRNNYPPHSIVQIVVWAESSGASVSAHYALLQSELPKSIFETSKESYFLDLMDGGPFVANWEFDALGANSLVHYMGCREAARHNVEGMCLYAAPDRMVRTTVGNIYLVMPGQKTVLSVSREAGALEDPMKEYVNSILEKNKLKLEETDGLTEEMVKEAVECFVCCNTVGLKPVRAIGAKKRLYTLTSVMLANEMKNIFLF